MTYLKPYLKINRLIVFSSEGKILYDEKFHQGVNIIRGENSSGKSTIANFIFYGLGGDFNSWTEMAKRADSVYIELDINDGIYTLRRIISDSLQQGMYIYFDEFEVAKVSANENWQFFPYKQSANKNSFSNILFGLLQFPELKGSTSSNITMNQILRLLYIDQVSMSDTIFRKENFDTHLNREEIANLLLGVYDDSLYEEKLKLKELEKRNADKRNEFKAVNTILKEIGTEIDYVQIKKEIDVLNKEIDSINNFLLNADKIETNILEPEIQNISDQLIMNNHELSILKLEISKVELDIVDSKEFIESLQNRLNSLNESISARKNLGELPIHFCPNCLSSIKSVSEDKCFLCKEPLSVQSLISQAERMKIEISNQIKESNTLLSDKYTSFEDLIKKAESTEAENNRLQKELDFSIQKVESTRDTRMNEYYTKKGNLEAKIENYNRLLKSSIKLEELKESVLRLEEEINRLKIEIDNKEEKQLKNKYLAIKTIEEIAIYFLNEDLDRQDEFKNASNLEIDFYSDKIRVNNRSNFSASSNVYLKNSILFAIFFASLKLESFRYPRFILCDNIEDKGMEPIRSQHFQKMITNLSEESNIQHQIIFTTSMIDPSLDNTPLCIGEFYTHENKSLKSN